MSRVDKWALTVALAIVAVGAPFRVWWDFHHPENWSPDSCYDPHIYLWAWAAGGIFIVCIALRIVFLECKRKRRERLAALLVRAEALVKQHRRGEAAAVLKECEELLSKVQST